MKIGIPMFLVSHRRMADIARRAESLGFESVWVPEHLVFPTEIRSRYPYTPDGVPPIRVDAPHLDPLVTLTHLAAATSTIRLGTNVYILPLRHPLVTARLAVSVDQFSGGRLLLGVGAGWLEEEFVAAGIDFKTRGARMRECARALRTLWKDPEPSFAGKFFSFGPVKFEPKPLGGIPLIFGGETDAALARAAALGDGWYGVGHTAETAAPRVTALRQRLEAAGRTGVPFEYTVSHAHPTLDADEVRRYQDAGIDRVVVLPWRQGREAHDALGRLADTALLSRA